MIVERYADSGDRFDREQRDYGAGALTFLCLACLLAYLPVIAHFSEKRIHNDYHP
jgi:hypothetical protein